MAQPDYWTCSRKTELRGILGIALCGVALLCWGCDGAGSGGSASNKTAAAESGEAEPPAPSPQQPAVADPSAVVDDSEPVDGPPPIRIEPEVLDFGIVGPSETREGVVKLINTGDRPIEILTVQPSCKCTTIDDISGEVIPPGGSVDLRAAMKAQSAPGLKKAEMKVLFDGYTQVVNIQLRNEVSLPVRVSPAILNCVKGQPQSGRIVLESTDGKPFGVCAIGGKPVRFIGFDPSKDEPRAMYAIEWDLAKDFPDGNMPRHWMVETDRADCPLVDVYIRHESTLPRPVLRLTDYRHSFGRIEQGTSADFVVDVTDLPEGERIATAASSSSAAKVELVGTSVEGNTTHMTFRVTPAPDTVGVQYIPFTIYTTSRQQQLAVWGQVVPPGHVGCLGK